MLERAILKLNHAIRLNPARHLYDERILTGFIDPADAPFLRRDWGGDVWDVGASIGKYTTLLAAANPAHRIYAFEPNLNSLYFLAYRTRGYQNVVIVPNGLTADGQPLQGSIDPDFSRPPRGPLVASISLADALRRFGCPRFIKMDIEGGEYDLVPILPPELRQTTLLIAWHPDLVHRPIPEIQGWDVQFLQPELSLLTPLRSAGRGTL